MAELYIYKTDFEPVILPGEQAHLITASEEFNVECVAVSALPEYEKNFGALTKEYWNRDNEDTNLEMGTLGLSQLRMRLMDDFKLEFNNLGTTKQWRTNKTNFYLRRFPIDSGEDFLKAFIFKSSEFFIWEDDTPRFDLYSESAQVKSVIRFSGWRFRCKKLSVAVRAVKTIWVSGWPSGAA